MHKPGRKLIPASETVDSGFDADKTRRKHDAANALALASTEIAERFGDGLPYDRARLVHEARFFMAQSAEAMLEAGKRLIQIKENEPHGEFIEIVTGQLGLSERSGRLMMQAALKYLSPALESKRQSIAVLGRTKLYDLMLESDDDLVELAEGGTVAGLLLDDMHAMSVREFREALTDARHKLVAKDRLLATKNKKNDKLQEQLDTLRAAPLPEQEAAQLDTLRTDTLAAEGALQRLLASVDEVMHAPATAATEAAARHSLDYLVQRVVDGCLERGITVDLAERVSPIWSAPIDAAVAEHAARRAAKKAR